MSVSGETLARSGAGLPAGSSPFARIAVACLAIALVAAVFGLIAWIAGLNAVAPPVAPKNPFGTGLREAAPAASGIGGYILSVQSEFYRTLTGALRAMKQDGAAPWTIIAVGFLYGVFHAAGPGHGKVVIAGYLVSSERTLVKGLALSLAAALMQALVAVTLVTVLALVLKATAASINATGTIVELASFAAVAAFGAVLLWRKAGHFVALRAMTGNAAPHTDACGPDCGHSHVPAPDRINRAGSWRETAGIVIAAGIRPCSGAIIVLVFALSQGLFATGIAAVLAMALGTAITTGALAALAVFAKGLALRVAGGRGTAGTLAIACLEVLAAACVLVLGLTLLAGIWTNGGAS